MGRTLKRVPLDFSWPLKKTWCGYLNPFSVHRVDCHECSGSGYSPHAKRFSDQWYGKAPFYPITYGAKPLTVDHPGVVDAAKQNVERSPEFYGSGATAIDREARRLFELWKGQWCHHLIQADVDALVAAGRLYDFTHRPRTEEQAAALREAGGYWMREHNGYTPTADEVNTWSLGGMAHDSINHYVCVKARCERIGVATECGACLGTGERWASAEAKADCDNWKEEEPPTGDGYQLWETTSEGSPVSPVFATIDELCAWCADNATTFGSHKTTADEWRRMLDADFVVHKEGNAVFL
jgi:hypothetical protein